MKQLILFFCILNLTLSYSQTWKTFDTIEGTSFKIDPYTNSLWVYGNTSMSTIENNGNFHKFHTVNTGDQGLTSKLDMAFTPGHTFYSKYGTGYGLYLFDNYSSSHLVFLDGLEGITYDGDSIFLDAIGYYAQRYTLYQPLHEMLNCSGSLLAQNGEIYTGNTMRYYNNQQSYNLQSQSLFLLSPVNTFNFKNLKDEIYIGHEEGITKAYLGQCYDTITQNTTQNMPSGNILEIEFDKNDSLWCLFGDDNDDAFAIASLHGDTWVNRIDAGNSPVNFQYFAGFEFDTLGNLWIASNNELHALLGPNSPAWLSTTNSEINNIEIFPNPTNGKIELNIDENRYLDLAKIELYSPNGNLQKSHSPSKVIELSDIPPGVYILNLKFKDGNIYKQKIIKQ